MAAAASEGRQVSCSSINPAGRENFPSFAISQLCFLEQTSVFSASFLEELTAFVASQPAPFLFPPPTQTKSPPDKTDITVYSERGAFSLRSERNAWSEGGSRERLEGRSADLLCFFPTKFSKREGPTSFLKASASFASCRPFTAGKVFSPLFFLTQFPGAFADKQNGGFTADFGRRRKLTLRGTSLNNFLPSKSLAPSRDSSDAQRGER